MSCKIMLRVGYRKLVLHFTINDLAFAERSVDARMTQVLSSAMAISIVIVQFEILQLWKLYTAACVPC